MLPDDLRELAKKTAKSIIDHGSIPMATLKESIILQEKVDTLLAKEIEFPEVEPYPEIPEVDLTPVIDKLEEILTESKKKDLLEYDLQINEKTRKKLKGDKGDIGPSGKDGINGIDGKDGINGIDGKDGVEISPEEVVSKLESLKGEKRLSVKAIKGLDEIIQNIRETRVVSGGVRTLANLYDVTLSVPTNGQALVYNATLQKWENGTISGSGITLKTNGSTNATQSILNLKQGTNVTISDDGLGGVTINSTASGGGSGDVVGPASAVNNNFVAFDLTTGKLIKDSGSNASSFATSTQGTKADNAVVANTAITGATKTKITYDAKGLVTAGADATTADIADSLNKRYVTDANLTTIGNQSGTNTGDQVISDATLSTSDITTNDFTTAKHGFVPKGTNVGNYLKDDGTWSAIAGGGDMVLASTQTVSGLKTFLAGMFGLRNVANTFTSFFTNTNTVSRTYTLKDADGTLAFTSDITGINSGTNTGDQTSIVGITGTKAQFNTAVTDGDIMYVGDAPTTHTHVIADVTGLQTALDNKLDDTQFVGLSKITVDLTAPATPATGDLWVDTN